MTAGRPLGDYLRARRELIQPGDVGLGEVDGRRRVAGLRRSEVAQLAGISAEYYIKLEQGREINPTDQVLDSLSRALQLDDTARSYLHSLARLPARKPSTVPAPDHTRIQWLIESWTTTAAIVHNRYNDIQASNRLMNALIPAFRVGGNSLRALLLDPAVREFYGAEWEGLTARSVALLRSSSGTPPYLVRTQQLIAELRRDSERFREVWPRNDVIGVSQGVHRVTHPRVGALSLLFARLPLGGEDASSIFLYYAEPGSTSSDALAKLAEG